MSKPTPTLHFRVATADDAPLIHPLVESAYRGDESRLGWTTEADFLAGKRIALPDLVAKITNPDGAVLLAFDGTTSNQQDSEKAEPALVGCCEVFRRSKTVAYFGMFAVSPRRQGSGIGRQLMEYAEEYCRRTWGAEKMEMKVLAGRPELVAWYVRRGYCKTGATQPFPVEELARQGGVSLVGDLVFEVMEKDLRGVDGVDGVGRTSATPIQQSGMDAVADLVGGPEGVKE
jgi:GNAT superfamily N-acetyltransferase